MWALLTNGKKFDFYKILFEKPIGYREVFSIDLSNEKELRSAVEHFQYLTKWLISGRGLDNLWHRISALDPNNIAKAFYSKTIINFLRRELKRVYKNRFSKEEIITAINRVVVEQIEYIKPSRERKLRRRRKAKVLPNLARQHSVLPQPASIF